MKTISAISIATKLKAAREGKTEQFGSQIADEPRITELLWSLQHASMQPGGLAAFVADLVQHFPGHFQTYAMQKAGAPDKAGRFTLAQCLDIWRAGKVGGPNETELLLAVSRSDKTEAILLEQINLDRISFDEFLTLFVGGKTSVQDAAGNSIVARALRKGCERFNRPFLMAECLEQAGDLGSYLEQVCALPYLRLSPTEYCPTLPDLLLSNMDRRAREIRAQIAETEVARTVRRELDFAIAESVPVPFIGESRHGKTKSIANYCDAHPGRARLVTVPNNSNSEMAFMRAHADAFGIEYTSETKLHALRDEVEFVIRNSGLAVIYDEAHALAPIGYNKTTAPRRLNWVRSSVIDKGVPCAFFATPQSSMDTLEQYAKTTGYNLSQWIGRMAPPVILSDVIKVEDIVAVARKQFPELTQEHLEEMADRAILSDGYLKNIELTGRRARFLARERAHSQPTTQDVMDAIGDMMPSALRVVTEAPIRTPQRRAQAPAAPRLQPRGSRPAPTVPEASAIEFPRRSTTPSRLVKEPVTVG